MNYTKYSPLNNLLNSLEKVKRSGRGYMARCPAHDDRTPSLSLKEADDGKVLLHCFAGCSTEEIVDAMGLELGDLYPDSQTNFTSASFPRKKAATKKASASRQEKETHDAAAIQAEKQWRSALKAVTHPYLKKKAVDPGLAGIDFTGELVLPVIDFTGEITSLQIIQEDGSKRLIKGGRKQGCFIPVHFPESAKKILICEGWATGQSLAELDPDAFIIAAVDAGNLLSVALGARSKWPHAPIWICADDDRDKEVNIGLVKAKEAALAIDAIVAIPKFPPDAPCDLSDFNDLVSYLKSNQEEKAA